MNEHILHCLTMGQRTLKGKKYYTFLVCILQLKLIFAIVAWCTPCDFTISIFNDSLSKIYSRVEQFHHYALHPFPCVNIDEHVIKGQVVVLWACAFHENPDLLVVLQHLLIQGVHGAHQHLADQPVQGLGPAEAVVAAAGLVGQHYCLPMRVDLRPLVNKTPS